MTDASCFKIDKAGVLLFIRLSPKAKREGFEGLIADADGRQRLKTAVNAPPVDGKANKSLIELLSKKLRLPKSGFEITAGLTDRNKTVLISGDSKTIAALIEKELTGCPK